MSDPGLKIAKHWCRKHAADLTIFDTLSVRTQECLRRQGLTDLLVLRLMDREPLLARLRRDQYFGLKCWAELEEKVFDALPSPWSEFCP
jgi:hypothetical protein